MSILVYFDESGTSNDPRSEVVAIGGCLINEKVQMQFDSDWQAVLSRYGVSRLHMREGSHRRGEYEGWSEDRWRCFLQGLLVPMRQYVTAFVGAAVANRDFNALAKEHQVRLYDPYFVCFQACVHDVAVQLVEEPQGTVAVLIFDNHPEFRGVACEAYERYRQQLQRGAQLGALSFAPSMGTPGLQVADLMAYELRLFWQACRRTGTVDDPTRYLMRELRDMNPKRTFFHFFAPETLAHWLRPNP